MGPVLLLLSNQIAGIFDQQYHLKESIGILGFFCMKMILVGRQAGRKVEKKVGR